MRDYFGSISSWMESLTKDNNSNSTDIHPKNESRHEDSHYRSRNLGGVVSNKGLGLDRGRRPALSLEYKKSSAEAILSKPRPVLSGEVEQQDTIWNEAGQTTMSETSDSDVTLKTTERRERHVHHTAERDERWRDRDRPKRQPLLSYPLNSDVDLRSRCRMLERRTEDAEQRAGDMKKAYDESDKRLHKLEIELERASQQLDAANRRTTEMNAHISRQSEELLVCKGELRRAEAQHEITKKLLDEKTMELNGTQALLNQTDTHSGADVIAMVNSLNAQVMQTAAFMADTLEFGRISSRDEVWQKSVKDVQWMLADDLIRALHSVSRRRGSDFDSTLIQVALQICLTSCCWAASSCWGFNDKDDWIKKIYRRIQKKENQVVTRRWRMMTRAHLEDTKNANIWIRFMSENLGKVLTIAGCPQVGHEAAFAKFAERLSVITDLALRLQTAVGEGIASSDVEPYIIQHNVLFQQESMEDMYDSARSPDRERIIGTTELGLRKTLDGVNYTVMAKAKVFLRSSMQD